MSKPEQDTHPVGTDVRTEANGLSPEPRLDSRRRIEAPTTTSQALTATASLESPELAVDPGASMPQPATVPENGRPRRRRAHRHQQEERTGSTLLSIVPVSAPVVLMVGPFVTVLVYVLPVRDDYFTWWSRWGSAIALAAGVIVAMAVAMFCAIVQRGQAAPEKVNSRLYSELCDRWNTMDARVNVLCPRGAGNAGPAANGSTPGEASMACMEAWAHRDSAGMELKLIPAQDEANAPISDVRWLLGTGFVSVYSRIHSAEEALTVLEPQAQVVGEALSDELRIKDSSLTNSEDLLHRLRWAITVLGGEKYLCEPALKFEGEQPADTDEARGQARIVLRQVRHALNRFRDERRGGLANARSQLIWTGLLTGIIAYALLGLAILVDAPRTAIIAAVVFYLVGAMIGLLNQLRIGAGNNTTGEEDFGLGRVRLLYSPVLSGLAAVGGVVVVAMLHASLSGPIVTYSEPAVPGEVVVAALEAPRLKFIFDLEANRFGVVLAAVFGLTPSLLVSRVQGLADRFQADLQSTTVQAGGR